MKKSVFAISFFILIFVTVTFFFFGCATTTNRHKNQHISRTLSYGGTKNEKQLYRFFVSNNKNAKKGELKQKVRRLASLYITEAAQEGINSDCAWVQMCLETGFLRFGNLVTPEMNNFCGLGAIDAEHPGERFATEQLGVRAHIQHLHAYATPQDIPLQNELIDARYKWVIPRGKAPTVFELSGTWAADKEYGAKLDALLSRLEAF